MGGFSITSELVGFVLLVLFAVAGAWWRVETAISKAKEEAKAAASAAATLATLVQTQLAEFRTHVAENYISKAGFRETMESVSETLKTINSNLTHLNERIDRVIDNQHSAPKRGGGQQ